MRGSAPGLGTEDHTAPWLDSGHLSRLSWQVPEKGEAPNFTDQDPWLLGFLPTCLPHPFSPPEMMKGLCFPWTQPEAEITKIWTLKEHSRKSFCDGNL